MSPSPDHSQCGAPSRDLWSVILAGGEGERTRPFIEQWLGRHLPKQYCTFVGTRSMLQHTWDRANFLTGSAHMITVLDKTHQPLVWKYLEQYRRGQVVFQPKNRDTAAGIFLPLTYIRAQSPLATVMLFPSDHFVFPEVRFMEQVRIAARAADRWEDRIILLGISPTSFELEYGWIEPGSCLGRLEGTEIRSINAFIEKPNIPQSLGVFAKGGLWSTFVLTARIDTLWTMGWRCFPDLMERFEMLFEAIGTPHEGPVLEFIYSDMPRFNFSSTLLQQEIERVGVLELQEVLWSDWGRPERIIETLLNIGGVPKFPIGKFNSSNDNSFFQPSARRPANENETVNPLGRPYIN